MMPRKQTRSHIRSVAFDLGSTDAADRAECGSSGGAPYRSSGVIPPPLLPGGGLVISPMRFSASSSLLLSKASSSAKSSPLSLSRYRGLRAAFAAASASLSGDRFSALRAPASLNARGVAPAVPPPATMARGAGMGLLLCSGGEPVCGLLGLSPPAGGNDDLGAPRFGVVPLVPLDRVLPPPLPPFPDCCEAAVAVAAAGLANA
mmetsp:Transcript_61/g.114  ORF Transcript_61/g.114 Transcript_61/m.114 type:complete len:204 (-) Transcript_61:240-851(-)